MASANLLLLFTAAPAYITLASLHLIYIYFISRWYVTKIIYDKLRYCHDIYSADGFFFASTYAA